MIDEPRSRVLYSSRVGYSMTGIALLVVAFVVHVPSLGQPLLEAHPFRQTQTAWTALLYYQQGIDLFHPLVPVLGAPFEIPFEFPLFQALASLVMHAGVAPDAALRATGLLSFLLTALLVWRLVVRLAGETAGLITLAAFLLTPFALLWSRTSMIEYLATAGAVGYVFFSLSWHDRQRRGWYWAALAAGAVAMLVKPTTAVLYVLPVVALAFESWRSRRYPVAGRARYAGSMLVLLAVPVILGLAWTMHADAIKGASPFTEPFTSANLQQWNFGTVAQRLDLAQWGDFIIRTNYLLVGSLVFLWLPLAFVAAFNHPRRPLVIALLLGALLGPFVFTTLYFVHDYYLAAISPIAATGVGLAASWLWLTRATPLTRAIGGVLAVSWILTLVLMGDYWLVQYQGVSDPSQALPVARVISESSRPDELVVLTGRDWDPAALYYARRRGLMVRGSGEDAMTIALGPELLPRLRSMGYEQLFDCPSPSTEGCAHVVDLTNVTTETVTVGPTGSPGGVTDISDLIVREAVGPPIEPSAPHVYFENDLDIDVDPGPCITVTPTGGDPFLGMPVPDGSGLRVRSERGGPAMVFLQVDAEFSEAQSTSFTMTDVPMEIYLPSDQRDVPPAIRVDPPDVGSTEICLVRVEGR